MGCCCPRDPRGGRGTVKLTAQNACGSSGLAGLPAPLGPQLRDLSRRAGPTSEPFEADSWRRPLGSKEKGMGGQQNLRKTKALFRARPRQTPSAAARGGRTPEPCRSPPAAPTPSTTTRPEPAGVIGTGDETGRPFILCKTESQCEGPNGAEKREGFPLSSTIL